jgi:hypothetical protein
VALVSTKKLRDPSTIAHRRSATDDEVSTGTPATVCVPVGSLSRTATVATPARLTSQPEKVPGTNTRTIIRYVR